jgi:hypothetical protein
MDNKPILIYKQTYYKPVRRMLDENLVVEAYSDQSVRRYKINTVYQDVSQYVDGIPLLNIYGQWIYNSLTNQIKYENPEDQSEN